MFENIAVSIEVVLKYTANPTAQNINFTFYELMIIYSIFISQKILLGYTLVSDCVTFFINIFYFKKPSSKTKPLREKKI